MLLSYFNTLSIQLNDPIPLIKATVLPKRRKQLTFPAKIALKSVSQQLCRTNGNGATVPLTSPATGTRPFLAPLPAPGAQSPAQLSIQWASRMRGTAGHPEIALLVRNQKEPEGWGGGGSPEDGNPGSKGEEGGYGWLVGVRMCVKGTVFVSVWKRVLSCLDKCLVPMQEHVPTCSHEHTQTHIIDTFTSPLS